MQTRQKEKRLNSNRHYSLRKLSVGLASVLIGISFLNGTKTTVKADTIANNNDEYVKAHENNESNESMQAALLKNTDVAEGDSVHMQSDKNVDTAGILTGTSSVQSSSAAQNSSEIMKSFGLGADKSKKSVQSSNTLLNVKNSNISTKMGEVSKAGNFEVAGDISSAQNSVAKPQQNNLRDDLDKQKTFTENNQAEAKNQENRKEDLGQNLTMPDETKSTLTTKSDAEKSIAGSSSAQQVNNQLNNRAEGNSQAQPQNSLKLAKRMLAVNLIETNSSPTTNGGFDEATWGKLDVNNWQGQAENGVYQLTGYTGDPSHVIVPNEADFEKAGKSTNGLQVGITNDTVHSLLLDREQTIAFSKTKGEKVKAIGTDWSYAFSLGKIRMFLSEFDGSNLDVSGVTNMHGMFFYTKVNDLTSLANWNVSNVTDMSVMFDHTSISDLTPLDRWNTSKVTDMSRMFEFDQISNLRPLAHWDTSKVTDMSNMFVKNSISDLTPLANWKTSKVTDMSFMFSNNYDLIDLRPIANWNISNVDTDKGFRGLFMGDHKLDLTNINNTPLMQGFLKTPRALQGSTFITNNVDLAKAVVGKEAQELHIFTNTATRTITFYIPHAAPEQTIQHIYYKTIAPVQIDWSIHYTLGGGGFSSGTGSSVVVGGHGSSSDNGSSSGGGFHYTLGGGGFSSGTGSSVVVGGRGVEMNLMVLNPTLMAEKTSVQPDSDGPKIVKTYPLTDVKESDWQLDDSKPNDDVIIDGVICFKPVKIPHVNGYKAYLMKDPVNPAMFLVSFVALPKQLQNNQLNNVQLPQKQSEQKQSEQKQSEQKQSEQKQSEQKQPEQKQSEQTQPEQKQPEQKPAQPKQKQPEQKQPEQKPAQPIQTRPADNKQVDQVIEYIPYTLMHSDSTFNDVNSFEPAQNDSAQFEAPSDSTQKDDEAKIVNAAKSKKHIVKKHVVKRHKKYAKRYHLKRRLRKHTKRSRHAKKRIIKHRKSVSRKFRKHSLKKHIKKA